MVRILVMWIAALLALSGCGDGTPSGGFPPAPPPHIPVLTLPWEDRAVQEVVEAQLRRDPSPLREALSSDLPEIRARAALALASVQDQEAVPQLQRLLHDPDSQVRAMAAFALGQVSLPDGGRSLMVALETEVDPDVRIRLLEALGKRAARGQADDVVTMVTTDEWEEAARILALSRMGVAGVFVPGLVDEVVDALFHPSPSVRKAGAYLIGRSTTPEGWAAQRDRVRQALDALDRDDPAAIQLTLGVGQLRDWADVGRLLGWLRGGEDWRIRVAAARALGNPTLLEADGVRSNLLEAITGDPSPHVAVAAAQALAEGGSLPGPVLERIENELLRGPVERWRAHVPLVEFWLGEPDLEVALQWARRVSARDDRAGVRAVGLIGASPSDEATAFLLESLDHRDARVRARALSLLGTRWQGVSMDEETMRFILGALLAALESGSALEAQKAATALSSRVFHGMSGGEAILPAARMRLAMAPEPARGAVLTEVIQLLAALEVGEVVTDLQGLLDDPDPYVRATAGFALERLTGERPPGTDPPQPESQVDWGRLQALGPEPRLWLRTDAGDLRIRLLPSQAPLTVLSLTRLAESGALEGVPFHRVIPGFVAQGGDYVRGDGSGFAGFTIRSEFTTVPFHRGVVGMASSGKDTEGSQFFFTHGRQPHLDGGYTAFGWVEEGVEVMDALLEGHRILEVRVEPDGSPESSGAGSDGHGQNAVHQVRATDTGEGEQRRDG